MSTTKNIIIIAEDSATKAAESTSRLAASAARCALTSVDGVYKEVRNSDTQLAKDIKSLAKLVFSKGKELNKVIEEKANSIESGNNDTQTLLDKE